MIGTLTMEDLARIRRMSSTDAESWLRDKDLTDEQRAQVLSLAGRDVKPVVQAVSHAERSVPRGHVWDRTRPLWFAAAWLMGASWRQLAYMHKIAAQTVTASADRVMQSADRQRLRINHEMSYEALAEYRVAFLKQDFKDQTPLEVANILLSTTELDK